MNPIEKLTIRQAIANPNPWWTCSRPLDRTMIVAGKMAGAIGNTSGQIRLTVELSCTKPSRTGKYIAVIVVPNRHQTIGLFLSQETAATNVSGAKSAATKGHLTARAQSAVATSIDAIEKRGERGER